MIRVIAKFLFDTVGGKALALGAGFVALVVWHQVDRAHQREVGRKEIKRAVGANNAETQAALAQQSSRIDTIIKGKETFYKPAPCKTVPAGGKTIPVEPKTS